MVALSKNISETGILAKNFLKLVSHKKTSQKAVVVGLYGDLGSGKTAFVKEVAKALGTEKYIISPTFVIMKNYKLKTKNYKLLIHIDAYRLDDPKELISLGWEELINDSQNLIFVEWADKALGLLPLNSIKVNIDYLSENERRITVEYPPA